MIQNNLIHEGERLDELQRNGYGIIQNPARFCFGMDAVLLSGFAKAKAGEKVLDLGTGTGIIPILMEAKTDAADFTALEIQEESADMARRSVAYNHLEDKIKVVIGDIRDASNIFGASSFHVITTNPSSVHKTSCLAIAGRYFAGERKNAYAGRQILYGTPPVPSGRDHE